MKITLEPPRSPLNEPTGVTQHCYNHRSRWEGPLFWLFCPILYNSFPLPSRHLSSVVQTESTQLLPLHHTGYARLHPKKGEPSPLLPQVPTPSALAFWGSLFRSIPGLSSRRRGS